MQMELFQRLLSLSKHQPEMMLACQNCAVDDDGEDTLVAAWIEGTGRSVEVVSVVQDRFGQLIIQ